MDLEVAKLIPWYEHMIGTRTWLSWSRAINTKKKTDNRKHRLVRNNRKRQRFSSEYEEKKKALNKNKWKTLSTVALRFRFKINQNSLSKIFYLFLFSLSLNSVSLCVPLRTLPSEATQRWLFFLGFSSSLISRYPFSLYVICFLYDLWDLWDHVVNDVCLYVCLVMSENEGGVMFDQ